MQKKSIKNSPFWIHFVQEGQIDYVFLTTILVLLSFGIVLMYSASHPNAYTKENDSMYYVKRQIFFAVMGLVGMYLASHVNMQRIKIAGAYIGGAVSIVLMLAVFAFPSEKDIHRQISIGPVNFQPSELGKLVLIFICAYILSKNYEKINSKKPWILLKDASEEHPRRFLRKIYYEPRVVGEKINRIFGRVVVTESVGPILQCGCWASVFCLLLFAEKHLSGTIIMFLIAVIMLYLSGIRKRWFVLGFFVLGIIVVLLYKYTPFFQDYMKNRIVAWLDKDYQPLGARWQTNQGLYAIASGGFLGLGIGGSQQKYSYVSEPQNDMVFSIICEETGVIGAAVIILLFAFLVYRGVVIAIHAPDRYSMMVAMGIVFQLGIQVFLNIAVATDLLPNTGISLPFFSYGGSSLMMFLGEMGIVLSISRTSDCSKGLPAKKVHQDNIGKGEIKE